MVDYSVGLSTGGGAWHGRCQGLRGGERLGNDNGDGASRCWGWLDNIDSIVGECDSRGRAIRRCEDDSNSS